MVGNDAHNAPATKAPRFNDGNPYTGGRTRREWCSQFGAVIVPLTRQICPLRWYPMQSNRRGGDRCTFLDQPRHPAPWKFERCRPFEAPSD